MLRTLAVLFASFLSGNALLITSRAPCSTRRMSYTYMKVPYDKTREGDYPHPHDDDYKFGDITKRVIRDMTGNKDYEFGDGAKAVSSASTEAAEKAAEAVINAGGTAVEAGAAAKKALDDSGCSLHGMEHDPHSLLSRQLHCLMCIDNCTRRPIRRHHQGRRQRLRGYSTLCDWR